MNIEEKISYYLDRCISHSPYSILEFLFYLETIEDFEECSIILKSLNRFNAIYEDDTPTNKKSYHLERVAKYISQETMQEIWNMRDELIRSYHAS